MRKKDLYFIIGALVIIGIFIFLSKIGRQAKAVSDSPQHAGFTAKTEAETCWGCHAPDSTVKPMPEHHPKRGRPPDKSSCFVCHKLPTTATIFLNPSLFSKTSSTSSVEEPFIWRSQQQKSK